MMKMMMATFVRKDLNRRCLNWLLDYNEGDFWIQGVQSFLLRFVKASLRVMFLFLLRFLYDRRKTTHPEKRTRGQGVTRSTSL